MDIALLLKGPNEIDLGLEKNDLTTDDGLRTAILISLYSDRRVEQEELPFEFSDRRGWWGDLFSDEAGDQLGSRLWLLAREKQTQETLNRAEDYSREALNWLVEDGIAESLSVDASFLETGFLTLDIQIRKPKNAGVFKYQTQWQFEADREN